MEINLVHVNIWLKEQNISMNSVRYDAHLRISALDVVAAYRGIDRKHAHTVLQRLISNQSMPPSDFVEETYYGIQEKKAERAAVTVAPSGVCCILSSLLPEPVYLRSCYIFTSLKTTSPTAHARISPLKQLRPEPPPSRVPPMTVNCFPCRASHVETERELTAPILLARLSL